MGSNIFLELFSITLRVCDVYFSIRPDNYIHAGIFLFCFPVGFDLFSPYFFRWSLRVRLGRKPDPRERPTQCYGTCCEGPNESRFI